MTRLFSVSSVSDPVVRTILGFGELETGWQFGDGLPISRVTIEFALQVKSLLRYYGAQRFEAFPRQDGTIVIAGYSGDDTLNVTCHSSGRVDVLAECGDDEIEDRESCSVSKLSLIAKGLGWKVNERYGYYTQNTIHGRKAVSTVSRQVYHQMGYQSLMNSARSASAEQNAIISHVSTPIEYRDRRPALLAS